MIAWAQARPANAPPPPSANQSQPATEEAQPPATVQPLIEDGCELSPADYANAFAELVAGNTELMAGRSGKPYLDESYVDEDGKLHIVITQAAAIQFRREWPHTGTFVNIVSMQDTCSASKSSTAITSGGASGTAIDLPGFGMLDMANPDFINQIKQIRAINPEAFDQGFRQGYEQKLAEYDPGTQAMIQQLIPMSEGTSVDEALDNIDNLLKLYNTATGIE